MKIRKVMPPSIPVEIRWITDPAISTDARWLLLYLHTTNGTADLAHIEMSCNWTASRMAAAISELRQCGILWEGPEHDPGLNFEIRYPFTRA